MHSQTLNSGSEWLALSAPDPVQIFRRWAQDQLAKIPSGRLWLAAEADLMRSVDAMQRVGPDRLGPVLVSPSADLAWFLVPLDAGQELADIRAITVRTPPWELICPPADYYLNGRGWLEKPDGSGKLTDLAALGAAFGPGGPMHLPVSAFV
ncbi:MULTISPECIES: hypothetical protein [unclassified Streptomyces]|uniref:hypothetical protein n=1 Tax=unclassified Streptomyces TaxID=2593676 RepID=UPI002023D146|nr:MULTISPECIES: hypothetical protein [unclassified Streptomyces]MCX4550638.1 hypothetical protein [Streptomyces sp. NBC_01500]WSC22082.1 hypothetical protein OIE60_21640 [Streptomyces sp. NBC_01766]